jgi:hypothetical protein
VKSEVALVRNLIVGEEWIVAGSECGSLLVLQSDIYRSIYTIHILYINVDNKILAE